MINTLSGVDMGNSSPPGSLLVLPLVFNTQCQHIFSSSLVLHMDFVRGNEGITLLVLNYVDIEVMGVVSLFFNCPSTPPLRYL